MPSAADPHAATLPDALGRGLSVYLDLLRFLAALSVFILHASFHRFSGGLPGLWHLAVLGNDAVMLFFVLSGFVIAHAGARDAGQPRAYLAARLARLWSVCLPALLLTALLDGLGMQFAPQAYQFDWYGHDWPVLRLLASALFLNELWFFSIQPFSNTPYWSVGYEFWYYMLFGAWVCLAGRRRLLALALLTLLVGPKILWLLPVWLAGVWASRTRRADRLSGPAAAALCVLTLAAYLGYRFSALPELLQAASARLAGPLYGPLGWSRDFLANYLVGALVALHFVGARRLLRDGHRVPGLLERPVRWLAGLSFALYLFHNPLLQFFSALSLATGLSHYRGAIVLLAPLLVVALLGHRVERGKAPLKRWLLARGARGAGRQQPARTR